MIQKRGDCQGECERKNVPINSKGLCSECQYKKTHGRSRQEVYLERSKEREKNKPIKYTFAKRKPLKTYKKRLKKSNTGELEMFKEIWEERPHICSNLNCRRDLGEDLNIQYFSHIRSKGAFPELRLDKNNIDLLCCQCHYVYEFQDRSKLNIKRDE